MDSTVKYALTIGFCVFGFIACNKDSKSVPVNGGKKGATEKPATDKDDKKTIDMSKMSEQEKKDVLSVAADVKVLNQVLKESESIYIQVLRKISGKENYITPNILSMARQGLLYQYAQKSGLPLDPNEIKCRETDYALAQRGKQKYELLARPCDRNETEKEVVLATFVKSKGNTEWVFNAMKGQLANYIGKAMNEKTVTEKIIPACQFNAEAKTGQLLKMNCGRFLQETDNGNYMKIAQLYYDKTKKEKPTQMKWTVYSKDGKQIGEGKLEDFAYKNELKIEEIHGTHEQPSEEELAAAAENEKREREEAEAAKAKNNQGNQNEGDKNDAADASKAKDGAKIDGQKENSAGSENGVHANGEVTGEYVGDQNQQGVGAEADRQEQQGEGTGSEADRLEGQQEEGGVPNTSNDNQPEDRFEASEVAPEVQT